MNVDETSSSKVNAVDSDWSLKNDEDVVSYVKTNLVGVEEAEMREREDELKAFLHRLHLLLYPVHQHPAHQQLHNNNTTVSQSSDNTPTTATLFCNEPLVVGVVKCVTVRYSSSESSVTAMFDPPFFRSICSLPGNTKVSWRSSMVQPSIVRLSRASFWLSTVCDRA